MHLPRPELFAIQAKTQLVTNWSATESSPRWTVRVNNKLRYQSQFACSQLSLHEWLFYVVIIEGIKTKTFCTSEAL